MRRAAQIVLKRPGVREIIFRDGSNLVAEIYTGDVRPRYVVRTFGSAERAGLMLRHLAKFAERG